MVDSIRYEVIGMLLLAAAIGGAAHSVLGLFGPGFGRADPALALLAIYPALASVSVTQTQALWAVDRPGLTSIIALVRLVVTVALLILLTPIMEIAGPALALLASYLVVVVFSGLALRHHLTRPLRVTWPRRERLTLVFAYAAGFAAAHAVEQAFPSTLALPLCLLAGALAYVAVLLLCGGLNERDRTRLGELGGWVRLRLGREEPSVAMGPSAAAPSAAAGGGSTGTGREAARGTFLRSTPLFRRRG